MFGKEKYSREAGEEAERQMENSEKIATEKKKDLEMAARNLYRNADRERRERGSGFFLGGEAERMESEANQLGKDAKKITSERIREEARKRLENLINTGHKEALVLNKEYDRMSARASRLRAETEQAERELRDFEREKLGMHSAEKK